MADKKEEIFELIRGKLPEGAVLADEKAVPKRDVVRAGYKHKIIVIHPDRTFHELTVEEWGDGSFDILNDEYVGRER